MEDYVERIYHVFKSIKASKDSFKGEDELLHACRSNLDPFIYGALNNLYGKQLKDFWNTSPIPYISDKAICIVERRCHPNLEFCIHNAAYFARGFSLHIFHSSANKDYIETICGNQLPNIHLHEVFEHIGTAEQGRFEYNELLKSSFFWNSINEDHVITIETDTYFLDFIPESIYTYDYVASRWPWAPEKPGGGGLSYRKTKLMKQIINSNIVDIREHKMQDTYASAGMKVLNAKIPDEKDSYKYFVETSISNHACGVHQWWSCIWNLSDEELELVIRLYLLLNIP
jgi:hypothetical protein